MLSRIIPAALLCVLSQPGFAQSGEGAPITVVAKPALSISGKAIVISGTTIIGKEPLPVSLTITDPAGNETALTANTDKKGDYSTTYSKAFATGKYTVIAKPADGKTEATATFTVATLSGVVTGIQNDLGKGTDAAQKGLETVIQILEKLPPSDDIAMQTEKLKGYRAKFGQLKAADEKAAAALKELIKQAQDVPDAAATVNKTLAEVEDDGKTIKDAADAMEGKMEEYKNKSLRCEMLNAVSEVCGAISLVLDFQGKLCKKVINLASDKGLPFAVERMDWKGNEAGKETKKLGMNTAQKAAVAVWQGREEVCGFIKQGMSLDICQYIFKVIYAQTCEELKGNASTTFRAVFLADNGLAYFSYDLDLKGELKLRYEKGADLSKGSEITGEFIGYRTRYAAQEDFEQVEKIPRGMTTLARKVITPIGYNLNFLNSDLGAGALAAVPGAYRVAVKGKVSGDNLKLAVTGSVFDGAETVETNRIFLVLIQPLLPIPMVRHFFVPIARSKAIYAYSIPDDKVFKLVKVKNKVTVTEKALKNVSKPGTNIIIKTTLNLTLSN